jgi:hypothetical protein
LLESKYLGVYFCLREEPEAGDYQALRSILHRVLGSPSNRL